MDAIYRDAFPDVFATCDFDFEELKIKDDSAKEDANDVEDV